MSTLWPVVCVLLLVSARLGGTVSVTIGRIGLFNER
jgi:hypothetical protein